MPSKPLKASKVRSKRSSPTTDPRKLPATGETEGQGRPAGVFRVPANSNSYEQKPLPTVAPLDALSQPVISLVGVTTDASDALKEIGILTVRDLATSSTFILALQIQEASQPFIRNGFPSRVDSLPSDLVDETARNVAIEQVAELPISMLTAIGERHSARLEQALGVRTVADLANWKPFRDAFDFLTSLTGIRRSDSSENVEAPPYLIPEMGTHPIERVQYNVFMYDNSLRPNYDERGTKAGSRTEGMIDLQSVASPIEIKNFDEIFDRPAVGAVVSFTQSWYALGLAYGHLLHTVALAPGETTRIAIIDWSRQEQAALKADTNQTEALYATIGRNRSISEVTEAVAKEAQSGFSTFHGEEQAYSVGGGSGAAFSLGGKGAGTGAYSLGGSGGKTDAFTNAFTSGQREVKGSLIQDICDVTHQAANSVRNRRASVVQEVSQAECENMSTRAITNFNHMHALTLQYYEVVQLYRTIVEMSKEPMPCLFLPLKVFDFSDENIVRRFRKVLSAVALSDELRTNLGQEPSVNISGGPDDKPEWIDEARTSSGLELKDSIPKLWRLPTSTKISGWKVSVTQGVLTANGISDQLSDIISNITVVRNDGNESGNIERTITPYQPVNTEGWAVGQHLCSAQFHRVPASTYRIIQMTSTLVDVQSNLKGAQAAAQVGKAAAAKATGDIADLVKGAQEAQNAVKTALTKANEVAEAAKTGAETCFAPDVPVPNGPSPNQVKTATRGIADLIANAQTTSDKLVAEAKNGQAAAAAYNFSLANAAMTSSVGLSETLLAQSQSSSGVANALAGALHGIPGLPGVSSPEDALKTVAAACESAKNAAMAAKDNANRAITSTNEATRYSRVLTAPGADGNIAQCALLIEVDLECNGRPFTFRHTQPVVTDGQTFPAVTFYFEGFKASDELLDERLYYSQAVWRSMGSALFAQLAHYSLNGQSLAQLIDPTPIGIIGNYVAFPLYFENEAADKSWNEFLHKHRLDEKSRRAKRKIDIVPLPSEGVFGEAVLGRFNSAEKLDITRFWHWQDSLIPITAPEIAPLQAKIPTAEQPNLNFSNLESPIINMTNPPSIPDPTGLSAALTAIATGSMFRDMSNAAETIQAAREALAEGFIAGNQAQETATKYSGQAAQVAEALGISKANGSNVDPGLRQTSPATISNTGGLINQGRDMDRRGVTATRDQGTSAGTATNPSWEATAFNSDLGNAYGPSFRDLSSATPTDPGNYWNQQTQDDYGSVVAARSEIEWQRNHPEGYVELFTEFDGREDQRALVLWNFDVGSADVSKFESRLLPYVRSLQNWTALGDELVVTGFTSVTGSEQANNLLGGRRASNVADWLTAEGKIGPKLIHPGSGGVSAYGTPAHPYRLGDGESFAFNRRVEIRRIESLWWERSEDNYIRLVEIANGLADGEPKARILKVLSLLQQESCDDRYVSAYAYISAQGHIGEDGYEWLLDRSEWEREGNTPRFILHVRDLVETIHPGSLTIEEDMVRGKLISIDTEIWEGLNKVYQDYTTFHEGGLSTFIQLVNDWIAGQQADTTGNSVYSAYR